MIPVEYPSQSEMEKEIASILVRAMPRHSLFSRMGELLCQIGLRRIFIGMGEIFFILLFSSACTSYLIYSICDAAWRTTTAYGSIFLLSPLSFSLVYLLCIWKEKEEGSWEVQMACRYTVLEIFSFRMLCFSLLSLLFNGISNGISSLLTPTNDFWKMNALSACSLLLFSAVLLLIPAGRFPPLSVLLLSLIWAAGFIPYIRYTEQAEAFLEILPDSICGLLAVLFAIVYILRLKAICFTKKRRGTYAFS